MHKEVLVHEITSPCQHKLEASLEYSVTQAERDSMWFLSWLLQIQDFSVTALYLFLKSSSEDIFIAFRGRGRGRERKKNIDVREKHQSVASCTGPNQGLNPQPGSVPWWAVTPTAFWCTGRCSNQLSHWPGGSIPFWSEPGHSLFWKAVLCTLCLAASLTTTS